MKKILSLLLALILVCSLLPLSAMAANTDEKLYIKNNYDGKWYEVIGDKVGDAVVDKDLIAALDKSLSEYLDKLEKESENALPVHGPNDHEYGYASNAKYHWLQCACGCKISMEPHVDPLDTTDDYCTCGYHFSDNAELVTLWLKDCKELKNFKKNVYEYETDAYTYKDVSEIKRIATRTFDSEATVELPEDLTLKEGENKIEIKVIAENKKATQTYTVIVNKEAKK